MDTFDAINRRRSVKAHDPIHRLTTTEETKLLEAAIQSPTSFNMQKWRFVVVRDPELQRRIRAAAADQAQVTDPSPAVIPHLWHPLLRIRQGTLYVVRAGFCRGLLVQGPRRLSLLQRPPDGTDSCASRRPRHSPGARAAGVPGVWWRHPTHRVHHRSGAAPEDPDTSRRTTRTAARLSGPWPADRLGRARAGPLSTGQSFRRRPTSCP